MDNGFIFKNSLVLGMDIFIIGKACSHLKDEAKPKPYRSYLHKKPNRNGNFLNFSSYYEMNLSFNVL